MALPFLDGIDRHEANACLGERLQDLDEVIARHAKPSDREYGVNVGLALDRVLTILRADRGWLASAVRDMATIGCAADYRLFSSE